jgi:membrane protein required for colicin V production
MNWIDVVLLVALGLFALSGLRQGMVRQIAGIVGLVLALILAIRFLPWVEDVLGRSFRLSRGVATPVGFLVIFLGVLVGVHLLAAAISKIIGSTPLALVDRLGGLALGLFQGALVLSIGLLVLAACRLPGTVGAALERSALAGPLQESAPAVFRWAGQRFPQVKHFFERPTPGDGEHSPRDPGLRRQDHEGGRGMRV